MGRSEESRQYKVAEVCRLADVQPYVLRYWETEFPALASSRSSGKRNWSQEELDLVLRIRELLYTEGFTIAGAKKKLEAELATPAATDSADTSRAAAAADSLRETIDGIREELNSILGILRR